jgi:Ca2+-binding EF-hand superfamily protein
MGAGNSGLFECWDEDGDGLCSYSEFLDSGLKVFNELDVNGDGRLTPEEVQ